MNRLLPLLLLLLLFSGLASGSALLLFRTQALPGGVQLEWAAANEPGILSYGVDRQDGPNDDFDHLTSLTASARPRYSYFDRNARPVTAEGGAVTYRLTVHTAAGTRSYLSSPTSDDLLGRSWDLIKQMFL
ncbi:hypothetical protein [Hymenobacter actinosclerus]|uniref:Uncharacterized protein n=1 Tax=Hymenobacter actinosclerus TaxID=82805 RepID=A0A1I0H541_9BACT|nr:hypothetical protein [Hymenobacter actinosclerus]SET78837.1 hypothetical protein SAMN04487998_2755 [Hymenobacter actinosclerus]